MIHIKEGVRFKVLIPQICRVFLIIDEVFCRRVVSCVITSANDGKHMNGSLHYVDKALDLRAHHIPLSQAQEIQKELQIKLGNDYDVLLESPGTENCHLHVEYDPED